MKEAKYTLTSYCLASGRLRLTSSLRKLFSPGEKRVVVDVDGDEYEVEIDWEAGELVGLGPVLVSRGMAPNQVIRFIREGDRLSLELESRRPPRPGRRVEVAAVPPPAGAAAGVPDYVEWMGRFGFDPERRGGVWVFWARMRRHGYSLALAREDEGRLEELRSLARGQVTYAGVITADEDAVYPDLVVVTESALRALLGIAEGFPLSPGDLEPYLARGRLGVAEVTRIKEEVASMLGERAQFTAVLMALSGFKRGQVFLIEDLVPRVEGQGVDVVARMLEVLAGPPFFAVDGLGRGEYRLRAEVPQLLDGLAAYAERLRARLPVPG